MQNIKNSATRHFMLDLCLVFCYRTASAIRSLRPIKLKTTMLLSSFKIRNVRSISFNVEPLVVTSSIRSTFWSRMEAQNRSLSRCRLQQNQQLIVCQYRDAFVLAKLDDVFVTADDVIHKHTFGHSQQVKVFDIADR